MDKGELIKAVSVEADITQKEADRVLGVILKVIIEAVSEGEKVKLLGFGTFQPKLRKARNGRNPKTGELIEIPETTVPTFSPGSLFKDAVK